MLVDWVGILFRSKKSQIQTRAKRLLDAFASESRKQASISGQRKLIRAQYEKGLLLLREDYVKSPYMQASTELSKSSYALPYSGMHRTPTTSMQIPISQVEAQSAAASIVASAQPLGKEKLRSILFEIAQMYSLQFKIIDNLLGVLKSEVQKL